MTNSPGQGLVSNILAIAGFIILIVIIIWGAYHFLNLASSGFSSLLSRGGTGAISLTAPKSANSGQPVDLSWKYTPPEGVGSFAFLYQCREGFQFRIASGTSTLSAIPCGGAFTVGNKDAKAVRLVPVLTSGTSTDVPFSIIYMTAGTTTGSTVTRAQGNATITITSAGQQGGTAGTGAETSQPPATTVTQPPSGTTGTTGAEKPSLPADLVVRILAVGVIDPISGNLIQRNPVSAQEIVAVKFDIKNQGGTASGGWYFTAQLPTSPATPYVSPQQISLSPGAHIENTLRFNNVVSGTFSVSVDPVNMVQESNENNNYASQYVTGTSYTQPYPPYYQQYY